MLYAAPGTAGAKIAYKAKYDNFINGQWTAPVKGEYFSVVTPINGKPYTMAARSTAEDIELALDAAHAAFAIVAAVAAERAVPQSTIEPEPLAHMLVLRRERSRCHHHRHQRETCQDRSSHCTHSVLLWFGTPAAQPRSPGESPNQHFVYHYETLYVNLLGDNMLGNSHPA